MIKHVYVAYRIQEDWCGTIGIYTTFDKAEAGLNRYLTKIGLNSQIPNNPLEKSELTEVWYKLMNTMDNWQISRIDLDKEV